jgi:hypothetical protein
MADNIETSNSFEALHYLGKTHKAQSPWNKTRLTKKKKINEAVKAALDERFAQHEQAVSAGVNPALAGKVDTGITDTGITLGIFGRVWQMPQHPLQGLELMKQFRTIL